MTFFVVCNLNVFSQINGFQRINDIEKAVFIQNMQIASKATKSLECNFTQQKTSTLLNETVTSKGMMYFKSPQTLRWEYTSPQTFAFIMNQKESVVKNNNEIIKLDAQSSKMIKNMIEMIIGMIDGNGLIDNKNFSATYFSNQKQTLIKLTPKNSRIKNMFTSIQVYVDSTTYLANTIEMNEAGGDITTIYLSNIKKNLPISDNKFKIR